MIVSGRARRRDPTRRIDGALRGFDFVNQTRLLFLALSNEGLFSYLGAKRDGERAVLKHLDVRDPGPPLARLALMVARTGPGK